jgi:hypothetical protein
MVLVERRPGSGGAAPRPQPDGGRLNTLAQSRPERRGAGDRGHYPPLLRDRQVLTD